MLSVTQGGIKYQFLSLWYDSTWDWTQVSRTIGEHSNHRGSTNSINNHLISGSHSTRIYLLCRTKFIAWCLRHPIWEILTGPRIFVPISHNLCTAPSIKWLCAILWYGKMSDEYTVFRAWLACNIPLLTHLVKNSLLMIQVTHLTIYTNIKFNYLRTFYENFYFIYS